ncbi:MAG: hypothetical protein AB2809_06810, partial [Candidatus Thiodiazotropha sp.]
MKCKQSRRNKSHRLVTLVISLIFMSIFVMGYAWASEDDEEHHDEKSSSSEDGRHSEGGGDSGDVGGNGLALRPKNSFNIMMNYELGMHCTGFEFAYCCVLPPYNSILAQVVKTQQSDEGQTAFARLLEGDPTEGLDALGRQTVLRDPDLDANGDFQKYVLEYWHD